MIQQIIGWVFLTNWTVTFVLLVANHWTVKQTEMECEVSGKERTWPGNFPGIPACSCACRHCLSSPGHSSVRGSSPPWPGLCLLLMPIMVRTSPELCPGVMPGAGAHLPKGSCIQCPTQGAAWGEGIFCSLVAFISVLCRGDVMRMWPGPGMTNVNRSRQFWSNLCLMGNRGQKLLDISPPQERVWQSQVHYPGERWQCCSARLNRIRVKVAKRGLESS